MWRSCMCFWRGRANSKQTGMHTSLLLSTRRTLLRSDPVVGCTAKETGNCSLFLMKQRCGYFVLRHVPVKCVMYRLSSWDEALSQMTRCSPSAPRSIPSKSTINVSKRSSHCKPGYPSIMMLCVCGTPSAWTKPMTGDTAKIKRYVAAFAGNRTQSALACLAWTTPAWAGSKD
jgi:hypothetical protein